MHRIYYATSLLFIVNIMHRLYQLHPLFFLGAALLGVEPPPLQLHPRFFLGAALLGVEPPPLSKVNRFLPETSMDCCQ
jgi:hypothetical protein